MTHPSALTLYFKAFLILSAICSVTVFIGFTLPMILAVAFWLTVMLLAIRTVHTLIMDVVFRHDPTYCQFRKSGGNAYDLTLPGGGEIPRVFNCPMCGTEVLQTGVSINGPKGVCSHCNWGAEHPEQFVPPEHWISQCPRCESRVEHAIDVCWNCNYGG